VNLLDLQQDQTATDTITATLSFDPSPPFFDGYNRRATSGVTLPPGYIDDHPILCVPTQLGRVDGTITISATNCPVITVALSCNGTEPCIGDCSGSYQVDISDVVTLVEIALGAADRAACPNGIPKDTDITIALLIQAVNSALNGCAVAPPQPTSTPPTPAMSTVPTATLTLSVGTLLRASGGSVAVSARVW
jgi:hypothetical protein